VDVGVERSLNDIEDWKARDPIARLSKSMIEAGFWSQSQEDALNQRLDDEIDKAWNKAMSDSYPEPNSTLRYVYAEK
jgi:TPP-dependent pyruvate/acetoin dehydrogenase alpha subunit